MNRIKTTITLQNSLIEQIDVLAQEMNISRNRFLTMSAEAFIERYESQERDELFALISRVQKTNSDADPDEVMQDIVEAQYTVRSKRDG